MAVADPLSYPRAETPTHLITTGMDHDLDSALRRAVREMVDLIVARTSMSREQAYQLCSLAPDFRITQAVNGEKGIHGMLPRAFVL